VGGVKGQVLGISTGCRVLGAEIEECFMEGEVVVGKGRRKIEKQTTTGREEKGRFHDEETTKSRPPP